LETDFRAFSRIDYRKIVGKKNEVLKAAKNSKHGWLECRNFAG
jgi:hypothetical protein